MTSGISSLDAEVRELLREERKQREEAEGAAAQAAQQATAEALLMPPHT